MTSGGAVSHSKGVTCTCRTAPFAPMIGRQWTIDHLHVRLASSHIEEDEIGSFRHSRECELAMGVPFPTGG